MSTADLLAQGIAAARSGRKDEAHAALLKVLEADDRNELAWLWLSGIFETPAERRVCLENVLEINPANGPARRGLDLLSAQAPPAPPAISAAVTLAEPDATVALAEPDATVALATVQTLWLPDANGNAPAGVAAPVAVATPAVITPAAPVTTDTIELPPLSSPAPPKQPWWRPRKQAAAATPAAATPAAATPAAATPAAATPAAATPAADVAPAPHGAIPVDPPKATLALPDVAAEAGNVEEPCPYCGATTLVGHHRCPACRKSLMVSGVRREDRSLALKILVGIYALSTLGTLGSGLLQVGGIAAMGSASPGRGGPSVGGIVPAIIVGVIVLIVTAMYGGFTLALWKRKVWAFILHWIGLIFNLLGLLTMVILMVVAGSMLDEILAEMPSSEASAASGVIGALAGVFGLLVLCSAVLTVGWLALTVACNGDFFGRKVRMSTAGIATTGDAYNNGIAYRNRGMWYMAAHEWELAARGAPRDVTVRRALGLAYAQLERFPQARDELLVAQSLAPGDPQLREDLAIVERLAAKQKK